MSLLMLAVLGCMTGVTTVVFGFGGGFVVVPLVYHLLISSHSPGEAGHDAAMQIAVGTSTAVMVITASLATFKQRNAGKLVTGYIWPLAGYIALGAVGGAMLGSVMSSDAVRVAFIAYLGLTIADCLLREGFLRTAGQNKGRLHAAPFKGIGIGIVATMLGVGGSVMTVPLLRRSGLSMAQSSALANPLSIPVALTGSLMYGITGQLETQGISSGFLGYIYLPAFALLSVGSLIGVRLALPLAGRMPDRLHARIYILLLVLVGLALAFK
ncbi:sulfite exporter TauE/SafE family protein [Pseudomonas baltica]|uniref:sulfite exporter TauE/SafE family protein n=1 Tax=Pseudomonas baltica TaxID=2762576 RepID=UPI00289B32C6|nr:sulfite exporter TauE/SafE family protein [Pseudomonas baltica]